MRGSNSRAPGGGVVVGVGADLLVVDAVEERNAGGVGAHSTARLSYGSDRKHRDGHDLAALVREIWSPGRTAAATF